MSEPFVIGQRLVNDAEPDLGLGYVSDIPDSRTVEVTFLACDEVRQYRTRTAPLRRLQLRPGQIASDRDGLRIRVESVTHDDGLLTYHGNGQAIEETDLEDRLPLTGPLDRLRAGHLDDAGDLELRLQGWKVRSSVLAANTRGMGEARVSLLPHQLYLARRIADMPHPRVLLADQVGLGKTIEAGLIFSALRSLGRASRVLIVVPDSLLHQWLAEMARRFNELFVVVNQDALDEKLARQIKAAESGETGPVPSPFAAARRALMPWTGLRAGLSHSTRSEQSAGLVEEACQFEWDLLIVDEAHHLHEGEASYEAIAQLSKHARGLLLLTGTPARGGHKREFGLLKLVDPQRYSDYRSYNQQRQKYNLVSEVAKELLELGASYNANLHPTLFAKLISLFPNDQGLQQLINEYPHLEDGYNRLMAALVDRHGPGRVFFRNRRQRLAHLFSGRQVSFVPLYSNEAGELLGHKVDRRAEWLAQFLLADPERKVVLIAKDLGIVCKLQSRLRTLWGLQAAVFHEELSLIERDKQAAWFSSPSGAQVLLCSEIGSEGRNFQFAHHLIFWDVPFGPGTIEQRIGRLDRIGQSQIVNVYVLYLASPQSASEGFELEQGNATERLLAWHKAIGSFEHPVEGGEEIARVVQLRERLEGPNFAEVLEQSRQLAIEHKQEAAKNVDYLVDINSFDEALGQNLVEQIVASEDGSQLEALTVQLLERFGVSAEELTTPGLYHIKMGGMSQAESLPGLTSEGLLGTFRRELALSREDLEFLSIDHALVNGVMSMLIDGAKGTAMAVRWREAPRAGLVLQCLFIIEALGPQRLELQRYLAPQPWLVNIDLNGRLIPEQVPEPHLMPKMGPALVQALLGKLGERLQLVLERAEKLAQQQADQLKQQAVHLAQVGIATETSRLTELSRVNEAVDASEVEAVAARGRLVLEALEQVSPRLDSLRLVLMEPSQCPGS